MILSIRILPVAIAGCVVLLYGLGAADAGSENTTTSKTETSELDLTELNMIRAKAWGLSLQDYAKSLTLREGVGSYWDDSTDPITLLGIHAKTASKRRLYAEKLVHFEYEMYGKLQAFENAHGEAWQKLYPKAAKFDFSENRKVGMVAGNGNYPVAGREEPIQQSDYIPDLGRLAYFISLPCQCEQMIPRLIASAAVTPVDIYIVNAKDDQQIQRWAMHMKIPIEMVQRSEITLNHDDGLHLKAGFSDFPVLTERTEVGYVRFGQDDLADGEEWQ